jgi:hypothetical protein
VVVISPSQLRSAISLHEIAGRRAQNAAALPGPASRFVPIT